LQFLFDLRGCERVESFQSFPRSWIDRCNCHDEVIIFSRLITP